MLIFAPTIGALSEAGTVVGKLTVIGISSRLELKLGHFPGEPEAVCSE
jgi:hypothetical protein